MSVDERESARKGLNATSGARFSALPLVKPVVPFARRRQVTFLFCYQELRVRKGHTSIRASSKLLPSSCRLLRKLQEGMRGYVLFGILFFFLFECSASKLTGTATKKLHIKTQLWPGFSLNQVAPYTKEIDKITSSYFFEIFTHILLKCRLCIRINL